MEEWDQFSIPIPVKFYSRLPSQQVFFLLTTMLRILLILLINSDHESSHSVQFNQTTLAQKKKPHNQYN